MARNQSAETGEIAASPDEGSAPSNRLTSLLHRSPAQHRVQRTLGEYSDLMMEGDANVRAKREQYAKVVNHFYDLVTDFYEYGWSQSFHFATRFTGETVREATARFEHGIALCLGLRPGMRVLDIGCGVGGPMRAIARFSGATITGINNNDYQIVRSNNHTRAAKLEHLCSTVKGNYMALDMPPDSIDCVYAIEATCHAPSLAGVYAQIWRVLKPGGLFACVEWCTTDLYDPENPEHRRLCNAVITGNGLMGIPPIEEALHAAREVGFEISDVRDLSLTGDIPWYEPLAPAGFSLRSFRSSALGRWCTNQLVSVLEALRIAPRGSREVSTFLNEAADALVDIGRAGIFTPDLLIVMRKPQQMRGNA